MSGGSEPVLAAGDRSSALEGRTVGSGRFDVRAELGRGGMGEVYRAYDRLLRREIALKVIAARYVGRVERERRFRNEAEYAQRVGEHPHVVSVLDAGELEDCGGRLFMTMEAVAGPTLAMELALSRRLPVDQAVEWARQIADGLLAIHAVGVVHRDITPSNILIQAGTNIAKIFDFGLAGELDSLASGHASRLTLLGEVPGTHGYMAPEQTMLVPPAVTMDVYAFGAVLTEMLVGHNPFAHLDRNEYIEWQQTSRDEAASIKRWGLALPDGLADLIDDCLRRDPRDRPQSGAELLERLHRIAPVVRATPTAIVVSLPSPSHAPPSGDQVVDEDALNGEATPPRRPRPWLVVAGLASLLVLIGGLVGWWLANTVRDETGELRSVDVVDGKRGEPSETNETASRLAPGAANGQPPVGVTPTLEGEPLEATAKAERPTQDPDAKEPAEPSEEPSAEKAPSTPPSQEASCETRRKRAHDALRRKLWKKVLGATQRDRCWPDETERRRLRMRALAETGQHAACVRLAADSSDPEIVKWRVQCEQRLWRP